MDFPVGKSNDKLNQDLCCVFKENQTPLKCKMQYFTSGGNLNIKGFSVEKYIEVGFLEVLEQAMDIWQYLNLEMPKIMQISLNQPLFPVETFIPK